MLLLNMFEEIPLLKRVLIWDIKNWDRAKEFAITRTQNKSEADNVLILVIKSNDWLNRNVKKGDVILH